MTTTSLLAPHLTPSSPEFTYLGLGIGLRTDHYDEILAADSWPIQWFEIISENFIDVGGKASSILEEVLQKVPVVQHGVSLHIGSCDPLNWPYLAKLKKLARKTKTPWISDHFSWGQVAGSHLHDLLPLPHTKEVVHYIAERARIVQDYLEVPLALENLSSYAHFKQDSLSEWEFISQVADKANISLLLDLNNVYVSSVNHDFNPYTYLDNIPLKRVVQIHLAGHSVREGFLLDTHDQKVAEPVWDMYNYIIKQIKVSTLLEWDDNFLSFSETCQEVLRANQYLLH